MSTPCYQQMMTGTATWPGCRLCCRGAVPGLQPRPPDSVRARRAQARQDLAQVKSIAGAASRKLTSMAQTFMKDLQGGY